VSDESGLAVFELIRSFRHAAAVRRGRAEWFRERRGR
jgi:hypothetical protein